ncbi:MAG: hypothetical protein KF858_09510 [Candidatus Sumerlaeia bacterium]|nr:hypothetical protein [Candidatus Sumerlaeia bacterium]
MRAGWTARWVVGLAALLVLAAGVRAELPATVRAAAEPSAHRSPVPFSEGVTCAGVHRSARLLTPRVAVGEPVVVEIRLVGQPPPDTTKIEFIGRMDMGRDVRAIIFPPRGQPYEFSLPQRGEFTPNLTYELRAGESVSNVLTLAYDELSPNGAFTFEAGTYGLRVMLACTRVEGGGPDAREFQPIGDLVLEVVPAQGPDATALRLMTGPRDFWPIQAQVARTADERARLAQLVEAAPGSALRPYAINAIAAHWYFEGTRHDGDLNLLNEAIALYDRFVLEYPDHPLAPRNRMRLVKAHTYLEDFDAAERQFLVLWGDAATSKMLRPREELRVWYFGEAPPEVTGDWMLFRDPADALKPDSGEEERRPPPDPLEAAIQEAIRQLMSGSSQQAAP